MTEPTTTTVDFHFDILCPFAYQTSRWIRRVRDQSNLTINWCFFSLEEVNHVDGSKHPWEREWSYGWSLLRIAALLRRSSMDDADRWYERAGRALHAEGIKPHEPAATRSLLAEIGIDPSVVDEALADETTHDDIHTDHARVIENGGYGVPTMFIDGHCLFGPVLIDPPEGEAAMRLWEAVAAWTEFDHLFELQRPKTKAHERAIVDSFQPYLEARDWVSVNRGHEIALDSDGIRSVGKINRDPTGQG